MYIILVLFVDFILDPGDIDVLSPWQQHLVNGHTFPHNVLRIWYSHFDISMDTTSVEDMYKTLCLLHAGRQSQVELPQVCSEILHGNRTCLVFNLLHQSINKITFLYILMVFFGLSKAIFMH